MSDVSLVQSVVLVLGGGGLAALVGWFYRWRVEAPKVNVDRQAQIIDDIAAENERLRYLVVDAIGKDETIHKLMQDVAELKARVSILEGDKDMLKTEKKLLMAQLLEAGLTPIVT